MDRPHSLLLLQLDQVVVQHIDRIAIEFRSVGVRVYRQQVAPLVVQARNPVARVKDHHVRVAILMQTSPEFTPRQAVPVTEDPFHGGLIRILLMNHVLRVEAQHVDHIAPESLGVAVRIRHLRHVVLVGTIADDHRHAVRVLKRRSRLPGQKPRQHHSRNDHDVPHTCSFHVDPSSVTCYLRVHHTHALPGFQAAVSVLHSPIDWHENSHQHHEKLSFTRTAGIQSWFLWRVRRKKQRPWIPDEGCRG